MPIWQQWLLGCYIVLFALVLPFICWGALAEPGHPHRSPHFVFTDPLLVAHPPRAGAPGPAAHGQHSNLHRRIEQVRTAAVCALHEATPVAGQSTPTLLLFIILLLLMFNQWVLRRLNQPQFAPWLSSAFSQSLTLAVPLPPPRFLF